MKILSACVLGLIVSGTVIFFVLRHLSGDKLSSHDSGASSTSTSAGTQVAERNSGEEAGGDRREGLSGVRQARPRHREENTGRRHAVSTRDDRQEGVPGARQALSQHEARNTDSVLVTGSPHRSSSLPLATQFRQEKNSILRLNKLKKWTKEERLGLDRAAILALDDSDPIVVMEGLSILSQFRSPYSTGLLLKALDENHNRPDGYGLAICKVAIQSLGKSKDASAVPALLKELNEHMDLAYDRIIVEALGNIGDLSALQAVTQFIAYLETVKPEEPIALNPWKDTMTTALTARKKLQ